MESTTGLAQASATSASSATGGSRLLVSPAADGATNMAIDEALLRRSQRTGETLLRVYGWAAPTVSLGRNQPASGCYDLGRARERGVGFVRRPTGGRAILHHREITYSVAAPVSVLGSLRESYRAINRLLLEALRSLGVEAGEAEWASRAPAPSLAPCFDLPVAGELVVEGRKLVGSAQVRDGNSLLQHGSILVDDDQYLLAELLASVDVVTPAATLHALTGRKVTIEEFAGALARAVGAVDGSEPRPMELDDSLLDDVRSLVRTRYAVADWTWRR
jgi:lipoate-protein ligase A